MPFDPTLPANNAPIVSAELRSQFNGLKTLIDALQTQMNGLLPVGFIGAWPKSRANIPGLPGTWVECNGQVLNDPASPFHGQTIDDLNGATGAQRFLRGASASGGTGGSETHTHLYAVTDGGAANSDAGGSCFGFTLGDPRDTEAADSLPSFYEVVWVMRVK